MKLPIIIIAATILGTGCATMSLAPKEVTLTSTFDKAQAEKMLLPGKNQIKGSALIRQRGGGVVTCAGMPVTLIPATTYATERIKAIYIIDNDAFSPVRGFGGVTFTPENLEYESLVKTTTCDAQGYFKFTDIADGTFYINSRIVWTVGYSQQGGDLIKKIEVKNGNTYEVVLSF